MSELIAAATSVNRQEPALRLEELNIKVGKGMRRRQFIHVIRDDKRAIWVQDLGPAEDFTAPEFSVPSLMEHTVAELLDIAETMRNSHHGAQRLAELRESSNLIQNALNHAEELTLRMRRKSVNGPSITVQRI